MATLSMLTLLGGAALGGLPDGVGLVGVPVWFMGAMFTVALAFGGVVNAPWSRVLCGLSCGIVAAACISACFGLPFLAAIGLLPRVEVPGIAGALLLVAAPASGAWAVWRWGSGAVGVALAVVWPVVLVGLGVGVWEASSVLGVWLGG